MKRERETNTGRGEREVESLVKILRDIMREKEIQRETDRRKIDCLRE